MVGRAFGWCALIDVRTNEGELESALEAVDQADDAAGRAGFEPLRCDLLGRRATVLAQLGRHEEAVAAARASYDMAVAQNNVFEHAWTQQLVGLLLLTTEPAQAQEWLSVALAEARATGYVEGVNASLRGLAQASTALGDLAAAAELFEASLRGFMEAGSRGSQWTSYGAILPLLVAAGRHDAATALLRVIEQHGSDVSRMHAPGFDRARQQLAARSAPDGRAARWSVLSPDQARALALAELRRLAEAGQRNAAEDRQGSASRGSADAELVRVGDLWAVTYAGATVHVPDLRGMRDLAVLLSRPGHDVAALDLATAYERHATASVHGNEQPGPPSGDLGERLDAQARAAYTARIRELQREVDEADRSGDGAAGARAQEELDFLAAELASAYGLHGPRRQGDPAEKARSAVTGRIRGAIKKIGEVHPALGEHLARQVRTGRFCRYEPDGSSWRVVP